MAAEFEIDESVGPWTVNAGKLSPDGSLEVPIPGELAELLGLTGEEIGEISRTINGAFIIDFKTTE